MTTTVRRDTPQRRVRLWLHDRECMSECTGEQREDHAKRTQTNRARDVVRVVNHDNDRTVAGVLHPIFCMAAVRGACEQWVEHRDELISRGTVARVRTIVKGSK